MGRKNHRTRRSQASRRTLPKVFAVPVARRPIPVEKVIIPHGRCHCRHHKLMFHEHEVATALSQAQALRRSRGQEAHMEKRYYHCNTEKGGCGAWHLTSRDTWTETRA
jgi:hypothetical protein